MLSLLILFLLLEYIVLFYCFFTFYQCCFVMRAYHVLTGKELATDFYS